jgi:hypothetical protein
MQRVAAPVNGREVPRAQRKRLADATPALLARPTRSTNAEGGGMPLGLMVAAPFLSVMARAMHIQSRPSVKLLPTRRSSLGPMK